MKTLGVIGGLGPESTILFYREYLSLFEKQSPVLIWSTPLGIRIQQKTLSLTRESESVLPLITEGAKRLKQGGADFLVLPCNSLHLFLNNLASSVRIPFINMIEETVNVVCESKLKRIGILGTPFTVQNKVYENTFNRYGIQSVLPTPKQQHVITRVIKSILSGTRTQSHKNEVISAMNHLKNNGAQGVVLGCTELSLLDLPKMMGVQIFDSLKITTRACRRFAVKT